MFSTASTRAVAAAAQHADARHILVPIAHCNHPELAAFGYYAAKVEQERVARDQGSGLNIVPTTQRFTFPEMAAQTVKVGPYP